MSSPTSPTQSDLSDQEIRSKFAQGVFTLLQPTVVQIDDKVQEVRVSQVELRQQIDALSEVLHKIAEEKAVPINLDPYVKKLNNAKRRVMLVNNILQNAQERIGKLQQNVVKEQNRRRAQLEGPAATGSA